MRTSFRGFYRPSDADFSTLWQECIFVVDANVLLNMYGYSTETRGQLLDLLDSVRERLWMPYRFASEYQRNRAKAISEQVSSYSTARSELEVLLEQRLVVRHRHPFVKPSSVSALRRICKELLEGQSVQEQLFVDDPVFRRVSSILDGRVGQIPGAGELDAICAEGRVRYAAKIPPGYSDSKKPEPDCFGDLVGWKEILNFGQSKSVAAILITDDQKEDWWHLHGSRRLGPRPELIAEYWNQAQRPFYMYTLEEFMRYADQHLNRRVTASALEEVRGRSVSQTDSGEGEKPFYDAAKELMLRVLDSYGADAKPSDPNEKPTA